MSVRRNVTGKGMMPTEMGPMGVRTIFPPMTSPKRRQATKTAHRYTKSFCDAENRANSPTAGACVAGADMGPQHKGDASAQRALSFMHATRPSVVCEAIPHSYFFGVRPKEQDCSKRSKVPRFASSSAQ